MVKIKAELPQVFFQFDTEHFIVGSSSNTSKQALICDVRSPFWFHRENIVGFIEFRFILPPTSAWSGSQTHSKLGLPGAMCIDLTCKQVAVQIQASELMKK